MPLAGWNTDYLQSEIGFRYLNACCVVCNKCCYPTSANHIIFSRYTRFLSDYFLNLETCEDKPELCTHLPR